MVRGSQEAQWEQRNREGLCAYCGKEPHAHESGRWKYCYSCRSAQRKRTNHRYHNGGAEVYKEKSKTTKKERIAKGLCGYCGKTQPLPGTTYCQSCKDKQMDTRRRLKSDTVWRENIRRKAMALYESRCQSCGFNDVRALQFHHTYLDGSSDRKRLTGKERSGGSATMKLCQEIIRDGKRSDIELLCANCHCILHWNESKGNIYRDDNAGMASRHLGIHRAGGE